MMKLGKISPLAFSRMKQRGISIDALHHLLAHGQVEKQFDGARAVYLDCTFPGPTRNDSPKRTLYAVVVCGGGCGRRGAYGGKACTPERVAMRHRAARLPHPDTYPRSPA